MSLDLTKNSFENLRIIRDTIHQFYREKIVNDLINLRIHNYGNSTQECSIEYIYSYPFVVIEGGAKAIAPGNNYAETIYSDATTSFFFKIPESPIIPKNHYVRVSIPCTFLYCSGRIKKGFFWNIINAIYFGGLYEKKKNERGFRNDERKNEFNEDLLINLTRLMLEQVAELQFSVVDMKLSWLAIIFAIAAIIITLIKGP